MKYQSQCIHKLNTLTLSPEGKKIQNSFTCQSQLSKKHLLELECSLKQILFSVKKTLNNSATLQADSLNFLFRSQKWNVYKGPV